METSLAHGSHLPFFINVASDLLPLSHAPNYMVQTHPLTLAESDWQSLQPLLNRPLPTCLVIARVLA